MSAVVVIAVAALAFLYVRHVRLARAAWLKKLDLPGLWHWQQGDAELLLSGGIAGGEFTLTEGQQQSTGTWSVSGHVLNLALPGGQRRLQLHYFSAGNIGLEDENGERRIYSKEASNVVPLRRH